MQFFTWLEATPLAEWVRTSAYGYGLVITVHALGMGIVTGLAWMIAARLLGRLKMLSLASLRPLFHIAWFGFIINLISGGALFTEQAASNYIHNVPYLTKMFFVVAGAATIGYLQVAVRRVGDQAGSDVVMPRSIRVVAALSVFMWLAAIVTGRLIAYLS